MILAIYTRKGGTGKTTTAITLGNILANKGLRTLLVDLDSQANATSHFLTTPPALDTSAAFLQGDMPIIPIDLLRGLAPASLNLAGVDYALVTRPNRFEPFHKSLKKVQSEYDMIIMDLPPAMNQVSTAALASCDYLLSPVLPDVDSLSGLALVEKACTLAGKTDGLDGIFLNMFSPRRTMDKAVESALRNGYGDKVYATSVRQCNKVRESHRFQKTVLEYAPRSAAAEDYIRLANEFLTRISQNL